VKLLLDSHAFLWWDRRDRRLDKAAAAAIADGNNQVFISAATVWELAIKRAAGKIKYPKSIAANIAANGFDPLAISPQHGEMAASLPAHHRDPFDRLLVAQATLEGCVLVTHDRQIEPYGVPCLWT
jgi:PIN domain nuclease of toxin-antitoxin system